MFLRRTSFWIGCLVGAFLPSAFMLAGTALVASAIGPKPGAWLPGPTCEIGDRRDFASPNGRFIASSVIIDCEDDPKRDRTYNYVFLEASRRDRIAHVFTLSHDRKNPAELFWRDNQSIVIRSDLSDTEEGVSAKWCGIATELEARP